VHVADLFGFMNLVILLKLAYFLFAKPAAVVLARASCMELPAVA